MSKKTFWDKVEGAFRRPGPSEEKSLQTLVESLEFKLGQPLPIQYREFLTREAEPSLYYDTCDVFSDLEGRKLLYSFTVRKFLKVHPGRADDIYVNYIKYTPLAPLQGLLPVAFDQFRNLMMLSLTDGKVYFWDIESRVAASLHQTETLKGDKLYLVSENFHLLEEKLYRKQRFN